MIGVLETCECGREFLRGIYPQKKCYVCDALDEESASNAEGWNKARDAYGGYREDE